MTAHFGDGAADISGPVMGYLKENANYADAFVAEYLRIKPNQHGFMELQQLYMLDLALSIWRYFQMHEGGLPDDKSKKWTFVEYAKPLIDYWEKYKVGRSVFQTAPLYSVDEAYNKLYYNPKKEHTMDIFNVTAQAGLLRRA